MLIKLDNLKLTGNENTRIIRGAIKKFRRHFKVDYPTIPASTSPQGLRPETMSRTKAQYDIDYQNELFNSMLDPDSPAAAWHETYTQAHPYPPGWEATRDAVPTIWAVGQSESVFAAATPPPPWINIMIAAFDIRFTNPTDTKDIRDELGRLRQGAMSFRDLVNQYDKLVQQLPLSSSRSDGVQRDELMNKMNPELRTAVRIHIPNSVTISKAGLIARCEPAVWLY